MDSLGTALWMGCGRGSAPSLSTLGASSAAMDRGRGGHMTSNTPEDQGLGSGMGEPLAQHRDWGMVPGRPQLSSTSWHLVVPGMCAQEEAQ